MTHVPLSNKDLDYFEGVVESLIETNMPATAAVMETLIVEVRRLRELEKLWVPKTEADSGATP